MLPPQRHLGDGDEQAAVRAIMHGRDAAFADQRAHEAAGLDLVFEIDGRRRAFELAGGDAADRATGRGGLPRGRSRSAGRLRSSARMSAMLRRIGNEADAADRGRRRNADAVRLVVERDVARDDGIVERAAGFRHAAHAADELAHDLGPLGIGEVHVVGDGERIGADGGQVAPRLDHGLLGAHPRDRR